MPVATSINSTNVRNSLALAWYRMHLGVASVLAPKRAVDTASRLFATPPRFAHTPREREFLATGERFDVIAPDARLAVWRFGNAGRPAIVASHGWGGRGAQFRSFVPALLEAGYQVVVFDHAGHGLSEGDESSLIHFMRDIGAVVARVETHGVKVVGMIGHSLGAAAAGAWLNTSRRDMRVVLLAPPTSIQRWSGFFARRRILSEFRNKGILVGRPFPPMINHLRVSVGVPEEMDRFMKAFKEIFPKKTSATMAARG